MAILAVEEEAGIMGIELEKEGKMNMLGRILLGLVAVVGPVETVMVDGFAVRSQRQHASITALQAHAALADSMHVGLTAAIIRWAWLMMVERHEIQAVEHVVQVHAACAGIVNAGYLAAERALQSLQLTAALSVASEKCLVRRDVLHTVKLRLFKNACDRSPASFSVRRFENRYPAPLFSIRPCEN